MLRNTFSNIKRVCVFTALPRVWRGHIMKSSQMKFQRLPCALFSSGKNKSTENERDRCDRILKYLFGEDENEETNKHIKQDILKERNKLLPYKAKSVDQENPEELFDRKIDAILKATSTIIKEEKHALDKAELPNKVNHNVHIQTSKNQDVVSQVKNDNLMHMTTSRKQGSEELEQKIEKIRDPSFVEAGKTGEDLADHTPNVLNNKIPGEKTDRRQSDLNPITQVASVSKIMIGPMKVFNIDKFSSTKNNKSFLNIMPKAKQNKIKHLFDNEKSKPINVSSDQGTKMQPFAQNAEGNPSLTLGITNMSAFDSTRNLFDKNEKEKKRGQEKSLKRSIEMKQVPKSKAKEANPYNLVKEKDEDPFFLTSSPIKLATKPEAVGKHQHESAQEKHSDPFTLTNKQTREINPKIEEAKSTKPVKEINRDSIVLTTKSETKATKSISHGPEKEIDQNRTSKPIKLEMEQTFPEANILTLAKDKYQDPFGLINKPIQQVIKPKGPEANLNEPAKTTRQETVVLTKNTKDKPYTEVEQLSALSKNQDPFIYSQITPELHKAMKHSADAFVTSSKSDLPAQEIKKDQQKLILAKLKTPTLGAHIDGKSPSIDKTTTKQLINNLNRKSELEDVKSKQVLNVHIDSNAKMAHKTSANIETEKKNQSNDLAETASALENMETSQRNIVNTETLRMAQTKTEQASSKLDAVGEFSLQSAQSDEKSSLFSKSDKTNDTLKEEQNCTYANSTVPKEYLKRYMTHPEKAVRYSGEQDNHLGLCVNQDLSTEDDEFSFPSLENDRIDDLSSQNLKSHVIAPVVGFIDVPAELCQPTPCPTNTYVNAQQFVKSPDNPPTAWIGAIVPLCPKPPTSLTPYSPTAHNIAASVQGVLSGTNSAESKNNKNGPDLKKECSDNEMNYGESSRTYMNQPSQTYMTMKQLPHTPMNMNQPYMRTCQSPQMYISLPQQQHQNMQTNVPNQMFMNMYQPQMSTGLYQQSQMYTGMYQQPQMCSGMYFQPQMTGMYQQPQMFTGMKHSPEETTSRQLTEWDTFEETCDVTSNAPRLNMPKPATTAELLEFRERMPQPVSKTELKRLGMNMPRPATSAELLALRASQPHVPFDNRYSNSYIPPSAGFTNKMQNYQHYRYYPNPMQAYYNYDQNKSMPNANAQKAAYNVSKLTNDFYNWLFRPKKENLHWQNKSTPNTSAQYVQDPMKPTMNWPPQAQWENATYYGQQIQERLPPKFIQTLPINSQNQPKHWKSLSKEMSSKFVPSFTSQVLPAVDENPPKKLSQTQMKLEKPQNQESKSNMKKESIEQTQLPLPKSIVPKNGLTYSKRIRQVRSQSSMLALGKNSPRYSTSSARHYSTNRSFSKKASSVVNVKTESKFKTSTKVSKCAKIEINEIFPVSKYLKLKDEQIFHTNQKDMSRTFSKYSQLTLRKTYRIPLVVISKMQGQMLSTVQDALTAALTLPPTEITNSNSENKTKQDDKETILLSTHQKLKTHIPAAVGPLPVLHDKKNLPLSALLSNNVDFTTSYAEHEISDPQDQCAVEMKCGKCGKCPKCKPPPPPPKCPPPCPPVPPCPPKPSPSCPPCPTKKS